MKYIQFRQTVKNPIFTPQDLRIADINYTPSQLTNWQKKGYIHKVRGGVYVFEDAKVGVSPFELAAVLTEPSYISLETILSQNQLIPEAVFTTTCITTKNTRAYDTYLGHISYRHLDPRLFFGYTAHQGKNHNFNLAEPEKALLDFIYLNARITGRQDLVELRLDQESVAKLDQDKLTKYACVFNHQRINHVLKQLRNVYASN